VNERNSEASKTSLFNSAVQRCRRASPRHASDACSHVRRAVGAHHWRRLDLTRVRHRRTLPRRADPLGELHADARHARYCWGLKTLVMPTSHRGEPCRSTLRTSRKGMAESMSSRGKVLRIAESLAPCVDRPLIAVSPLGSHSAIFFRDFLSPLALRPWQPQAFSGLRSSCGGTRPRGHSAYRRCGVDQVATDPPSADVGSVVLLRPFKTANG